MGAGYPPPERVHGLCRVARVEPLRLRVTRGSTRATQHKGRTSPMPVEAARMGGVRRWSVVVVRGRSMLPTLHDGDLLLVHGGPRVQRRAREGRLAVVRLPGG